MDDAELLERAREARRYAYDCQQTEGRLRKELALAEAEVRKAWDAIYELDRQLFKEEAR